LRRVRAPQETGYARVFPVPEWLLTVTALVLWCGGWGLTARQAWRRRTAWRLGVLTTVVGGAALAAAFLLGRQLDGVGLAVVTDPVPLRAIPALGADTRATPMAGEVAQIVERSGVWVHVRLDGNRDGWLPAERITALRRD
jgi:hypothetical protein